jgi:DedD protein
MRDENAKIREKFELSLDGRQIASIVVGALVILGVVFVLGLNVGRQISARQAEAAHAGDLEALDRAPAGAAHVDEKTLTFHDRLTKEKPAAQPPMPSARTAEVDVAHDAPLTTATVTADSTVTATAARAPTASSIATSTPTSTSTSTSSASPTSTSTPTSTPSATPAATPAATATGTKTGTKTAAAGHPPSAAKASDHKQAGTFAVQFGASQSRADAERLAARFHAFHPRVEPGAASAKGRWWRVRAGSFDSREAAERFRRDVARGTGASAFVVASR